METRYGEDYNMLIKRFLATGLIALVLLVSGLVSPARAERRWHRRHHVVYAYRRPYHPYYRRHYWLVHRRRRLVYRRHL